MTNPVSYLLGKATQTNLYQNMVAKKVDAKTIEKAVAYTTIGSIAIKDGVGCGMYVYQSLNNDKIPEKRRKFVAALDLTNGVLMIASQIAMFFAMRKVNDKLFAKMFPSFNRGNIKQNVRIVRANEANAGQTPHKKREILNGVEALKCTAYEVFKSVTELVAATILAKRIVVPFIATPLAKKVEAKMDAKEQKEHNTQKIEHKQDSSTIITDSKTQFTQRFDTGSTNLLDKYRK